MAGAVQLIIRGGVDFGTAKLTAEANGEMHSLANEACASMHLPVCPPVSLDCLTPDCIFTGTVNAGFDALDKQLSAASGFPVHLPRKFTMQGLEDAIGSYIPTNFYAAVDLMITTAAQLVATGITDLLVAAGVGSIVPGLGTLVGIGVALGIGLIRGLFAEDVPGYKKLCTTYEMKLDKHNRPYTKVSGDKWSCPPFAPTPPLQLLASALGQFTAASHAFAARQARSYCQGGQIDDCMMYLRGQIRGAAAYSLDTAPRMTGPEVMYFLPALEAAPKSYEYYNPVSHKIEVIQYAKVGIYAPVSTVLAQLRARATVLVKLATDIANLETLGISATRDLQMQLLDEVPIHAAAVQNSQGQPLFQDNARLLVRLMSAYGAASARLLKITTKLPSAAKPVHVMASKLKGSTLAARYVPLSVLAPRLSKCAAAYDAWAVEHRDEARCVDVQTKNALIALCFRASADQITPAELAVQSNALIARACARRAPPSILDAFLLGFGNSANPFAVRSV